MTTAKKHEPIRTVGKRAWTGWILGLIVPVSLFFALPSDLSDAARATAAVGALLAIWWVTEPIPIPVTSLLPLVLFPTLGVAEISETAAPYANSVIFLVLGGTVLGLAVQRWNLHWRIALITVLLVGTKPRQVVLGLMIASTIISMWVSNTATAVIMVPIAISVLGLFKEHGQQGPNSGTVKLGFTMLLGVAYAVTMGSMSTLIGQPPMAIMRAYLEETHGIRIGFGHWMLFGVPFAAVMVFLAWAVLTLVVFRGNVGEIPGGKDMIRRELKALGRLSAEERRVLAVFGAAITCWLGIPLLTALPPVAEAMPWLTRIDDTSVAVLAACLMFAVPATREQRTILEWQATRDVPWGVLLLFGGGLSLSAQMTASGLGDWIGESVGGAAAISPAVFMLISILVVLILTELTSNTAMAAAFLPIMGAIAVGVGISPLLMTIVVTLALSCSFMLPVATPSNAVAFATGKLPITAMVRAGLWMNLVGIIMVATAMFTLVPMVFGVSL